MIGWFFFFFGGVPVTLLLDPNTWWFSNSKVFKNSVKNQHSNEKIKSLVNTRNKNLNKIFVYNLVGYTTWCRVSLRSTKAHCQQVRDLQREIYFSPWRLHLIAINSKKLKYLFQSLQTNLISILVKTIFGPCQNFHKRHYDHLGFTCS